MEAIRPISPKLTNVKETKDPYSRYDCYVPGETYVELKHRGNVTHYDDTMIEFSKWTALSQLPGLKLYTVYSCGKIYVFNLNRLHNEGYDYNWEVNNYNATTRTGKSTDGVKKPKKAGRISWDQADKVIEIHIK